MNKKVTEIINRAGITEVGFCAFDTVKDNLINCRAKQRIPENAKSIILCLFPYKVKEEKPKNISRYAAVPDYHIIAGKYLDKIVLALKDEFPKNNFEWFIDNSPIPEVYAAACAGIGVIGENGLLINDRFGSWCFIGEIVTDLELEGKKEPKKCCLCGNCKNVCCIGIHGTRCLSAVSQQKKELKSEEIQALKENNIVWGCDMCADVCPMNKNTELTYIKEFIEGYRDCYTYDEDITGRAYEWRGEKVVKRNFQNLNSK